MLIWFMCNVFQVVTHHLRCCILLCCSFVTQGIVSALHGARVVFLGGFAAMAFAGGHGRPPEVSFVRCYRLAWSRYVDVEAARGCLVSGELYAAVGAVSRA